MEKSFSSYFVCLLLLAGVMSSCESEDIVYREVPTPVFVIPQGWTSLNGQVYNCSSDSLIYLPSGNYSIVSSNKKIVNGAILSDFITPIEYYSKNQRIELGSRPQILERSPITAEVNIDWMSDKDVEGLSIKASSLIDLSSNSFTKTVTKEFQTGKQFFLLPGNAELVFFYYPNDGGGRYYSQKVSLNLNKNEVTRVTIYDSNSADELDILVTHTPM